MRTIRTIMELEASSQSAIAETRLTVRERLEIAAGKPLRGGTAAPGGLFDLEARDQLDLFE